MKLNRRKALTLAGSSALVAMPFVHRAKAQDKMIAAMGAAKIDSPRGPLSFNKAHNPIQNIYLREVRNGRNEMVSIAQSAVDDPARGCKLT